MNALFLRQRSTDPEQFDSPGRSLAEVSAGYRQLARVNRLFHFSHPFEFHLPRLLGREHCRRLSLLDVGGGDGALGRHLTRWASRQGWEWSVTLADINQPGLALASQSRKTVASAVALPFREGSFDVAIASQMTHHLDRDEEVTRHFQELWRVSRRGVLVSDMHRGLLLYSLVSVCVQLLGLSRELREDGRLSVRRSFRADEWRSLASAAGLNTPRVWLYGGVRLMLAARKA